MNPSNKQHLVLFTPGFPSDELDSTCVTALQIFVRAISEQFHGNISVISFQYPYCSKHYRWFGVDVFSLGGRNQKIWKYWIWRKASRIFKGLHQKRKVTHIHSFWMGECAYIGSKLGARYEIPHICTLMGQDVMPGNRYFEKIRDLPPLITLSKYHASFLRRNYALDSKIVPWGIIPIEQSFVKDIDVVGVGNLVSGKCFDQFIEVIRMLKVQYRDIKTVIIGDGAMRSELKQQIRDSGLENHVSLLGTLPHKETLSFIARAKILLHMSEYESFGMVIIEALSVQTWVVCRPVGIGAEIRETLKVSNVTEAVTEISKILQQEDPPPIRFFEIQATVSSYLELIKSELK